MPSPQQGAQRLESDCLVILQNGIKLPVSSSTLAAASEPLARIFSIHLQEPRTASLPLPEINKFQGRNADAVAFLLSALQNRLSDTVTPALQLLKEVATLVHEYECAPSLTHISTTWLSELRMKADESRWQGNAIENDKHATDDLVGIAYLFDNAAEFYKITKQFTLFHRAGFCDLGDLMDKLPPAVILSMAERKRRIFDKVSYDLNNEMNQLMAHLSVNVGDACNGGHPHGVNCGFLYLASHGQDFHPRRRQDYMLDNVLLGLMDRAFTRSDTMLFVTDQTCDRCRDAFLPHVDHFIEKLENVGTRAWELLVGVCLDCAKTRGSSFPNCRVTHGEGNILLGKPEGNSCCPFLHIRPGNLPGAASSDGQDVGALHGTQGDHGNSSAHSVNED
ncbi:hypothetical protein DIS24_g1621 [Lasiodiplodia hormozganensis]|uniref:BTB domain-containing protein n=1 Tax=Lasiodiplodia hormozganensis TaxID=869390 RepID=A0AA40D503_9PEZI|nr:hypothetical protein DIS24_g1621 [Lasiodiplodia hormozganensis]